MADGTIRIDIEVDGKQVLVAAKELDKLEESGQKSGKGIKSAENSMDSLSESSSKAGSSVKSAGDAIDNLGDSGSKAGKGLKGADGAIDGLSDSSANASTSVKGTSDSLDSLAGSGSKASKDLKGADGAIDGLADSSVGASSGVKGVSDSLSGLGNSGSQTSRDLNGASSTIDGLADSSTDASSSIQGVSTSLDGMSDSGANSSRDLMGVDSVIDELADSSANAASGVQDASSSLSNMSDSASAAANSAQTASNETESMGQETGRASMSIKDLVVSLGLVAIASKAFSVLKSSLDSAISRFDTLNTFPVIMQQVGFTADQSTDAIDKLSSGIDGLPTTLDTVAATAQRLAVMTSDLDGAVDATLALNNAFIASGSDSANASRGLEQYVQMLAKGEVDLQSWRTLQETMGLGLNEVAKSFGFAGASAQNDFYEALKFGSITFDEFNSRIIELDQGVGGFAERAKTSSGGIATSLGNLKNAAARGVANMIESFNNLSKKVTGKEISANIDSLKVIVNASFKAIGAVIEGTAPIVMVFASAVQTTLPVVNALTPALIGLASAYAIHSVINLATTAIKTNTTVIAVATAAKNVYAIATNRLALAMTLAAVRIKLMGIAIATYNKIVGLAIAVQAMLASGMTLASIGAVALSGAIGILGTAIKVLLGPVGWVTLAIGALVGAVIGIVKWFNRASVEATKLNEKNEELESSTEELNSTLNASHETYGKNQTAINATARANEKLAQRITELAEKENKSAAEKKLLQSHIEHLNGSVEGLNLAYNEEANALSMSSEQLTARINLMKEQEKFIESENRLLEIEKEKYEVESKRGELNALQEEWNQKKADGVVKGNEYREAMAGLEEQEQSLTATLDDLAVQQQITEQQMISSAEAVTTAIESGVRDQMVLWDSLKDHQKETVENMRSTWQSYLDAATDMFDKISTKSEISAQEMQKNLEHNQKVISDWADNIAKLAERGVDQGLLDTLREAGPQSAGHVKALVNATDEELAKLSGTFAKGADVATDAFNKGLDIDESGAMSAIGHFVTGASMSLRQEIESAQFQSIGTGLAEGVAEGVEGGTPQVEKASEDMMKSAEEAAKKASEQNSPSKVFERIGDGLTEGLVLGVNNGTTTVLTTAQKLVVDFIAQFKNLPTEFQTIGKDAMAGFNRGLVAGEAQVVATARSIANSAATTMRKALEIHSPSKVTTKIGKQTGEGFAKGISKKQKAAEAAAKKSAQAAAKNFKGALDSANYQFKVGAVNATDHIKSLEKVRSSYAKTADQVRKVNLAILDVQKKSAKESYETSKNYIEKLARDNEISLKDELILWLKVQERYKVGTKERIDAEKNVAKVKLAIAKEEFENSKQWIDRQKKYNGMALAEELIAWERVQERYKAGSKDRQEAEEQTYRVKKEIHDKLTSLNNEYFKNAQEVMQKEADEVRKLNEEYQKAEDDRTKSLYNFAGIFDEVKKQSDISGQQLIVNLKGQVETFAQWSENIKKLAERGIDEGLLAELREMGPKAAAEIKALTSLSDSQLERYSSLWKERSLQAREQATSELVGMKEETEKQIDEINKNSEKQLEELRKEWETKIQQIRTGTKNEFNVMKADMHEISIQSMNGMITGLESMRGALLAKARSIVADVQRTMSSALDIRSPSRWMRDMIGRNMMLGWMRGIDAEKMATLRKASEAAEWMKPEVSQVNGFANKLSSVTIPDVNVTPFNVSSGAYGGNSTSNSTSNAFSPQITNNFTREESSPSESTRKQEQLLTRLGMEYRGR